MDALFRRAVLQDAPFVARLVRELYHQPAIEAAYAIPFDYESTLDTVARVIDRGVCIVGPHSCAGAFISPFPFNHAAKIGYVQFWHFREKEFAVLKELFEQLKSLGVNHVWAVSHPPAHRIARLYQKLGLRQVEGVWSKRLT